MLKLIGSIIIVMASIGLAYSIKRDLTEHLRFLYEIRRMLVMLSGEADYSMQPMEVLLGNYIKQGNERLHKVCDRIAKRLMEKRDGTGEAVWREEFESCQKELGLNEEETEIIKNAGNAFFGKSMDENRKHLSLTLERLDFVIENTRKEQKEKQKVYQTVSVICGLMLIILLI